MVLALAPMAGFTDAAFRQICAEIAPIYTTTEMISAMGFMNAPKGEELYLPLLNVSEYEKHCSVQVFGHDSIVIAETAARLCDYGVFSAIDINMGCPVKKIVSNGDGSALMKNPKKAAEIVEAASKFSILPITVKMRIGWDDTSINAIEFAQILENAGADLITVHGRTRESFYSGKADWDTIAEVKNSLSIPVIANGDVFTAQDAVMLLKHTACDGLMIGRGALGNPWIFSEVLALLNNTAYNAINDSERYITVLHNIELAIQCKGERQAMRELRSQLGHYFNGRSGAANARKLLNKASNMQEAKELLDVVFS